MTVFAIGWAVAALLQDPAPADAVRDVKLGHFPPWRCSRRAAGANTRAMATTRRLGSCVSSCAPPQRRWYLAQGRRESQNRRRATKGAGHGPARR